MASGISCLSAGSILYVRGGTYSEDINSGAQTIPVGSSWTNVVTISAYPGETPVVRSIRLWHSYVQYIVINGLSVDNQFTYDEAIYLSNGSHHIRFSNVEVKNAKRQGILIPQGSCASPCRTYHEFVAMNVHDNGRIVSLDHGFYIETGNNLIEKSDIYDNAAFGIQIYNGSGGRANDNIVRQNTVRNNYRLGGGTGCGIVLGSGANNMAYNNIVRNNPGCGIVVSSNGPSNTKIHNNTFYNNGSEAIDIYSGSSNTSVQNNIFYQNGGTIIDRSGSGTITTNNLSSDPKFLNAGNNDFHLQSGSAAINAGATLTAVTSDFDGNVRPQDGAFDIGAYEFTTTTSTLIAPTNLAVNPQ